MRVLDLAFWRNVSIKRKLTLIIMGTTIVALVLVSAAFLTYARQSFRAALVDDLQAEAQMIGFGCAADLPLGYDSDVTKQLAKLSALPHIVAGAVYTPQGQLFGQPYRRGDRLGEVVPPVLPEANAHHFASGYLVLSYPIRSESDVVGTIYLKSDLGQIQSRLRDYAATVLSFMLLSSLVAYLVSARLQRVVTGPVFHLAETAKAVSTQRNYGVRAVKHGQDELGLLIDGFNEMLDQIQERDAALRKAHDQLEQRVQERTRELQQEIVERGRAEHALQQQLTRTSLLNQITQAISERQDLESILHVVLRQLEEHLGVDLGIAYLFVAATQSVTVAAFRVKSHQRGVSLGLREGADMPLEETGLALCRHGETVSVRDAGRVKAPLLCRLGGAGLRSATGVPLMVENKLFGLLVVARADADAFTSGEAEFLRTLSGHVALAAHQARLHTELQSAYNELRQTQQAVMQEERLRALGQMASGIAHDINNALSPAVGFADLLLESEDRLSPSGRKYLQNIKTAGDDITHIVSRLREFYRRRQEREPFYPLDLNQLVLQVVDLTRPRWRDIPQGRGLMVEVRTDLDPAEPRMMGIESEIREALTNLVFNAIDAMPAGGTLTFRTRLGGGLAASQHEYFPKAVVVEVADTGAGMDEETRKHCLEPFFSTKGQRGTGLGLAMVYGVVQRHEGQIEIESVPDQGTTMRLIFPLREPAGEVAGTDDQISPVVGPLRLLCIDDEPLVRELLKEILEFDGHSVHLADNGQAGVDAFRAALKQGQPFDVVFTDLGMPYLDGRQVAEILKREQPTLPVIMLTGWGAFMKADGETPAHVDGVLSKPPRMNAVREALARVVSRPNEPPEARPAV